MEGQTDFKFMSWWRWNKGMYHLTEIEGERYVEIVPEPGSHPKPYDPFKENAIATANDPRKGPLWVKLASLVNENGALDEEGVVAFANSYGFLGEATYGPPFGIIRSEDIVKLLDNAVLEISVGHDPDPETNRMYYKGPLLVRERLSFWRGHARLIRKWLHEYTNGGSRAISASFDDLCSRVGPHRTSSGGPGWGYVSLFDAIHFMLYQEVTGAGRIARCEAHGCSAWFIPGTDNALYCSPTCKRRVDRKRERDRIRQRIKGGGK